MLPIHFISKTGHSGDIKLNTDVVPSSSITQSFKLKLTGLIIEQNSKSISFQ